MEFASTKYFSQADADYLIYLGVPEDHARWALSAEPLSRTAQNLSMFFMLLLLIGGMLLVIPFTWMTYSLGNYVPEGWLLENALLVETESLAAIFFIFTAIIATGLLAHCFVMLGSKDFQQRFTLTEIRETIRAPQTRWLNQRYLSYLFALLDPNLSSPEYYQAFCKTSCVTLFKWTLIPASLTVATFAWDLNSSSYASVEQAHIGGRLQWKRVEHDWSEATQVASGFYYLKSSPQYVYRITFGDGSTINLGNASTLSAHSLMASIQQIDSQLRRLKIPWKRSQFEGGLHEGKQQFHDQLVIDLHEQLSEEDWRAFRQSFRVRDLQN